MPLHLEQHVLFKFMYWVITVEFWFEQIREDGPIGQNLSDLEAAASDKPQGMFGTIIRSFHEPVELSSPGESPEPSTSLPEFSHFLHYLTFSQ